jgi:hypothetical protein
VVAETGEAEKLARGVIAVIQNPEERSTKIENARKWSEANSFRKSYHQIRQVIDHF